MSFSPNSQNNKNGINLVQESIILSMLVEIII